MLLRSSVTIPARRRHGRVRGHVVSLMTAALLACLSSGCRGEGKATLSHLNGLEELKARFNRDAGTPRIVLLMSPT